MFRPAANFERLLDKATNNLQLEPDWPTTMQICDSIRQGDVKPKPAVQALRKKLFSSNAHTALYALLVLESMMKNCGSAVHEEVTTKQTCDMLHELIKSTGDENVRQKILDLLQTWNVAFRNNPIHSALHDLIKEMTSEGYKFPAIHESDAMFLADAAPQWADGNSCYRCHVAFNFIQRKHHCRACGQIFCANCTSKVTTLPKYGIEREVRVCDLCYNDANKPSKSSSSNDKEELPREYLNSSLAQQNQEPPRKSEAELREDEEIQLALALSQSEAEANEKNKMKFANFRNSEVNSVSVGGYAASEPDNHVEELTHPELAKYLNRSYWEQLSENPPNVEQINATPSAPSSEPVKKSKENGHNSTNTSLTINAMGEPELEEFIQNLKSQVEIFINRMKSNSSRGRSISTDTSVQSLFSNITTMHSTLIRYIEKYDDTRMHFERLQDKLTQVKDAREALDALRDEHRERLRREAEEADRQRQLQMAHKLEIMRKKKQEYLQYQRQLTLQRIQEQEREMQIRQEQQKQQYLMGPQQFGGFMGSPVHAPQFVGAPPVPPQAAVAPPPQQFYGYQQPPLHGMVYAPAPQQFHPAGPAVGMPAPPAAPVPMQAPPPGHFVQSPQGVVVAVAPPPQQKPSEADTAELISFD